MPLVELPLLPYPPSINRKFIGTRAGRYVANPAVRHYKNHVANVLKADGTIDEIKTLLIEFEVVHLVVCLHRKNWITQTGKPSKTAGDIDAGIKVLQDAIFAAVNADDSCVFALSVKKSNKNLGFGFDFAPHVSVFVEPYHDFLFPVPF